MRGPAALSSRGQLASPPWSATPALLVAWTLLATGISLRDGTYSPVALLCVTAGYAVLLAVVLTRARVWPPVDVAHSGHPAQHPGSMRSGKAAPTPQNGPDQGVPAALPDRRAAAAPPYAGDARRALAVPAALILVGSVVWARHWYAAGSWLTVSHWAAGLAAVTAVATLWPRWGRARPAWLLPAALAALAGIAMIIAAPRPHIDVWYLLQDSTRGLAEGRNMYHQVWPDSTGLYAVYPYLPITSVLLAPFRWLFGDVRYGLLLAALLASFATRRLAGAAVPALLPLLILLAPKSTFALQQSWTEPLLVAALAGMVLAMHSGHTRWAVAAFALALATKQHMVLLIPLAIWWPAFGLRRTAAAAAIAAALVAPWVVADPVAFFHDAVYANLALDVQTRSLGLPSLLVRHGVTTSFLFTLAALVAAYSLIRRRRLVANGSGFALAGALVFWTLDLTNKQAFFNHYTLPMALIVIAIAAATGDRPMSMAGPPSVPRNVN